MLWPMLLLFAVSSPEACVGTAQHVGTPVDGGLSWRTEVELHQIPCVLAQPASSHLPGMRDDGVITQSRLTFTSRSDQHRDRLVVPMLRGLSQSVVLIGPRGHFVPEPALGLVGMGRSYRSTHAPVPDAPSEAWLALQLSADDVEGLEHGIPGQMRYGVEASARMVAVSLAVFVVLLGIVLTRRLSHRAKAEWVDHYLMQHDESGYSGDEANDGAVARRSR